jgi:uncharacterized membrane protein
MKNKSSAKLKTSETLSSKKDAKTLKSFNAWFIASALAFFAIGIYELFKGTEEGQTSMGATWIALGAVFIALSGTTYTPPNKKDK